MEQVQGRGLSSANPAIAELASEELVLCSRRVAVISAHEGASFLLDSPRRRKEFRGWTELGTDSITMWSDSLSSHSHRRCIALASWIALFRIAKRQQVNVRPNAVGSVGYIS